MSTPMPKRTGEAFPWITAEYAKAATDRAEREDAKRGIISARPTRHAEIPYVDLEERVWVESVDSTVEDLTMADTESHWHWVGGRQGTPPRPTLRVYGVLHGASRLAFRRYRGGLQDHLTLRRTCEVQMCVNPWHHEQVPNGHWRRGSGYARQKLTAFGGAEYAEEKMRQFA